ncbi:hypothetical protein Angca_006519, partial [Angiostrongylus cantonensis]
QVFGVPVEIAIDVNPSLDGIPLPAFFRYSIDYVEAHGIMQEGIYRVSSPKSRLDELEKKANEGVQLDFCDGHEAAGLIKRFLRQLPSPLLSCDFEVLVRSCFCDWRGVCQCVVLTEMKEMLRGIGRPQFYLLGYIVLHAQNVIKMESKNKMGIHALGLLFQAIMDMSRQLVCYLISNGSISVICLYLCLAISYCKVFRYVPPRAAADVEGWLCEDKPMIEEELKKQNYLLAHLHRQTTAIADAGGDASALESQLWGVQTAITALKRRLKAVAEPTPSMLCMTSSDQPCIEMFEEKQLMAVQSMLRQDILEEKRRIAYLCWMLRSCNMNILQAETSLILSETWRFHFCNNQVWRERCELEEAARTALVEEIVRLRNDCATLRAKIE